VTATEILTADDETALSSVLDARVEKVAHDEPNPMADAMGGLGAPDLAPSWHQHNSLFNRIADMQGVEPGSWEWLLGGVAAWSGQSGEHASYGWRHHHKVTPDYVRAVIANYGHRRTYYSNAPFRGFGYADGGRPKGWTPELPGDNPDGSCDYLTSKGVVTVSGPEAEHFWLDPLWALVDSPAVKVATPWGPQSSQVLAGVMATMQVRSIMGAIRDPSTGQPYPWGYGDRANSRILDTWLQAAKRRAMDADDAVTGYQFIVNVLLPHYEAAPGIGAFGTAPSPSLFPVGTFNSLYWLLPVFHDATQILPNPKLKERFQAIVNRYSQWALELEETVPGRGFDMSRFYVDRAAFTGAGKPLASIKPLLNPKNIVFDLGWELWSFRACSVAAKVTGSPVLKAAEQALLRKHGADINKKKWLAASDRSYAIYQPVE
jgi:hypothetical protein